MHQTVVQIIILIYLYTHIANAQGCSNEPFVIDNNNGTLFNISPSGSCWCNNYIGNGSQLLLTQNTYLLDTIIKLNASIQLLMASIELKSLTNLQRDNLTALNGMTIYNTDNKIMEGFVNDTWQPLNHPSIILTQTVLQLIPNGTNTKVNMSVISVNDNTNVFNVSDSAITVMLSGTYLICGSLVFPSSSASRVTYFIMVNNIRTLESNYAASNTLSSEFFIMAQLHLNSGDIVFANVFHTALTGILIGDPGTNVQLQPKLSIELISYS